MGSLQLQASDFGRFRSVVPEAPGRPRLQQTDDAILDAVVASLIEGGIEGTTIDGVAKRSNVGRPTIYRRYKNKYEMIEVCVAELFDNAVPEPLATGHVRADLENHLKGTINMLTETPVGPIFRAVISDVPRHPRIATLVNKLGQTRRRRFIALLDSAVRAGDIRIDQSPDVFADALLGAIYFRYLMGRSVTNAYALEMLNALIGRRGQLCQEDWI
jgi:AcrR family transcriptional regulator